MKYSNKYHFILVFMLICSSYIKAQKTIVYGKVKEDSTLYSIMYAKINFMGTQIGTTTDTSGIFKLSIPNEKLIYDSLIVSCLGFKTKKIHLKYGKNQEINIQLSSEFFQTLDEIKVVAGENPAWNLIRKIIENKTINNPENLYSYSSLEYSKIRFDLNNFTDKIKKNLLLRPFDYIWENTQTTENGLKYLPMLMTEQVSKHYYQSSPKNQRNVIIGEKTTGLAGPKLKEFTNDLYIIPNIYKNYITILGKSFPSPLNNNYKNNYKFYLIDSTKNTSGKTYNIRFRPKYDRRRGFTGEMAIDSTTFAIKEIKLRFDLKANINFVRSYYINQFYKKTDDSWIISESQVIGDFTVIENSSDLTGFFGRKKSIFSNTEINTLIDNDIFKGVEVTQYSDSAILRNKSFWEKNRSQKLSKEEIKLVNITNQVKNDPAFKVRKNLILTLTTGYAPLKSFEIGNIYTFYSFNNIENHRFKFGIRTHSKNTFPIYISSNIAYGTKDKKWKYNLTSYLNIQKEGNTRIGANYKYDIEQIGRSFNQIDIDHIISSFIQIGNNYSRNYVRKFNPYFEQRIKPGIITRIGYFNKRINPTNDSVFYQFNTNGILEKKYSYFTSGIDITIKFSYLNKTITGDFYDKKDLYQEFRKYPDIAINYKYADKNLFHSEYEYQKITAYIKQKVNAKKLGYFTYNIEGGKTLGNVPYIDLNIPFGNQLILTDDYAFNLMNFMEFVSDQYITIDAHHHFEGLILDIIPLINRLKWRSFIFGKAFFSSLSDNNNQSTYLFPQNLSPNNNPYYEIGFGFENIFKFAKIDFTWRLTPGEGEYIRFLIKPSFKLSF